MLGLMTWEAVGIVAAIVLGVVSLWLTIRQQRRKATFKWTGAAMASTGPDGEPVYQHFLRVSVHVVGGPVTVESIYVDPVDPLPEGETMGQNWLDVPRFPPDDPRQGLLGAEPLYRPRRLEDSETDTWSIVPHASDGLLDDNGGMRVRVVVNLAGRRPLKSKPFRWQMRPLPD